MGKLSKAIGFDSMKMADWLSDRTAEGGRVNASWSEYRQAFINFFPGLPPEVTRDTWTALSQEKCGSYHKFLKEIQQQAEELQAGEPERIHDFKRGLLSRIRSRVEIDPVTTREWASFAKLRDAATGYATAELTSPDSAAARVRKGDGERRSASVGRKSSYKRKRSYTDDKATNLALTKYHRKHRLCDVCHEPGHMRADCKNPPKPDWQPPADFRMSDLIDQQDRQRPQKDGKKSFNKGNKKFRK